MFGFYRFENYYFGHVTCMKPSYFEWEGLKEMKIASEDVTINDNYSYPTLLLKINDNKYIDLFHEHRDILINRNVTETCYVLNYVEPVGNYFPQDMLINKKYLTKKQAIEYFGDFIIDFDKNNYKKDDAKTLVYSKKED